MKNNSVMRMTAGAAMGGVLLLFGGAAVAGAQPGDGRVDLALTSPVPDEPGLVATPLAEEELRLAVPSGHRLAGAGAADLAEVIAPAIEAARTRM